MRPVTYRTAMWLTTCTMFGPAILVAQDGPRLPVGQITNPVSIDGRMDEPDWARATNTDALLTIEPREGEVPVGRTVVRVLAGPTALVIGIQCLDPNPAGIVSFSKARDAQLRSEDHVKLIFDTFLDGRTGYIFAVNANGARYDALVDRQGEGEAPEWDAAWEAATSRSDEGWTVEIRIPIQSLGFARGVTEWGFNIERRVQRLLETSRWASPQRDAKISQPSRAGRLTGLPVFDFGIGFTLRPTVTGGFEKVADTASTEGTIVPSLDLSQRLGPNALASVTVNTDFAETEVDVRRTNLTRFSLFFPEKRTFFLEGADIFQFGIGLNSGFRTDLLPFHSRRIGLYQGQEVPLRVGGKVNGRSGNTNVGALAVRTGTLDGVVPASTMAAARIKQNVLAESSVGAIMTFGDPEGRSDSWLVGADATYQTSRLWGDKNFLVGAWVLRTDREDLTADRTAWGVKVDYPNDTWDIALTYKHIGDDFDPSLGFVARRAVQLWSGAVNYRYRPPWPWLREMFHELLPTVAFDLNGRWESYRVFTAPINWRFESGERFEFNVVPEGERLVSDFEIAPGVFIPGGSYHWVRYRLEQDFAAKRPVSGRVSWWFGDFYDGHLHQISGNVLIKPSASVTLTVAAERNVGDVSGGHISQSLLRGEIDLYFSPDLHLSSLAQYDNESRLFGANTRLRWTFHPLGDLFVVYNHNVERIASEAWKLDSNQLLVKLQYAVRM